MSTPKNAVAPNLPVAVPEYDRTSEDGFRNVLRLYFNQLKNALGEILSTQGGQYLAFPYGSFSSRVTQSVGTINTPTRITLNTTDFANGMYAATGDGIHFEASGLYNFAFSMQATNADTQAHDVAVWFRKNGSDIAWSDSV